MRNLQITPGEIVARWNLPEETADELSVLLLAQKEGQIPQIIIGGGMEPERFDAACTRLLDKGLIVWSTNKGWAFDREPFSPTSGRRCGGYLFLSREGAMAALPYAADLFGEHFATEAANNGPDALSPAWITRQMLEWNYMPRLVYGPAAPEGRNGDLYAEAPAEAPEKAIGALLVEDCRIPFPGRRPDRVDATSVASSIRLMAWALFERASFESHAHVGLWGIDDQGFLVDGSLVCAIDPHARKALGAYGNGWFDLGEYDPEVVMCRLGGPVPPYIEGEDTGRGVPPGYGQGTSKRDFRVRGDIGRPLSEAEALTCHHVPGTGIDVFLAEAAAVRAERLTDLAGPQP